MLAASGLTGDDEVRRREAEVAHAARVREQRAGQVDLRSRFLRGELTTREVDLLGAVEQARAEELRARGQLSLDQHLLARAEARVQAGIASEEELEALRLRVEEGEGAVLVAELELEVLRAELGR